MYGRVYGPKIHYGEKSQRTSRSRERTLRWYVDRGLHFEPWTTRSECQRRYSQIEPLADAVLHGIIDRGIARYVARYGDKTQVVDPATGRARSSGTTVWPGRAPAAAGSRSTAPPAIWVRCRRTIRRSPWGVRHAGADRRPARRRACLCRSLAGRRPARAFPPDFEGAQGFLPTHYVGGSQSQVPKRVPDGDSAISGFDEVLARGCPSSAM